MGELVAQVSRRGTPRGVVRLSERSLLRLQRDKERAAQIPLPFGKGDPAAAAELDQVEAPSRPLEAPELDQVEAPSRPLELQLGHE